MTPSRTRALLVLTLLAVASPALATNGYFSSGYGTPQKAMAGACVALPLTTLGPATNPAADAFVLGYDASVGFFMPDRGYTVTGNPSGYPGTVGLVPGKYDSSTSLFVVPSVGANWKLGESMTFGVAIYGNGGMNTTYDDAAFYAGRTGVDLSQLFLAPTLTYRLGANHAIGITPILAYQRFQAEGLASFGAFSSAPASLTNNGHETSLGWGGKIGYLGKLAPWLNVGASYQLRTRMGEFEDYEGLYAEQGDFDVPSTWTAGIAVMPVEPLTIAVDVQRINYSEVKSVANPMLPNLMTAPLGADGGAGFGWRDMTVVKAGLAYAVSADWTVRAGYSYGRQPVPESEVMFNILAPGVIEQHVTAGVSKKLGTSSAAHFAATYGLEKKVEGPNPLEAPGQQRIQIRLSEWDLELGLSLKF
jgi:long-chain fatty acid transport protein